MPLHVSTRRVSRIDQEHTNSGLAGASSRPSLQCLGKPRLEEAGQRARGELRQHQSSDICPNSCEQRATGCGSADAGGKDAGGRARGKVGHSTGGPHGKLSSHSPPAGCAARRPVALGTPHAPERAPSTHGQSRAPGLDVPNGGKSGWPGWGQKKERDRAGEKGGQMRRGRPHTQCSPFSQTGPSPTPGSVHSASGSPL